MKIAAIIEARMRSTRLPGKVFLPVLGKPVIEMMVERIKHARYIDKIIIATTTDKSDDRIEELCKRLDIDCYRGSEDDVLSRVLEAARAHKVDLICELTGDCPLIDPIIIDQVVTMYMSGFYDYTANGFNEQTYPRGLDVKVFPTSVLEKTAKLTTNAIDHVHVSCFIYHNPKIFRLGGITAPAAVFGPDIRITLDTAEDYELIKRIFEALYKKNKIFLAKDIVKYLRDNPELLKINRHVRQKDIDEG